MTRRATLEGFLINFRAPTAPQRQVSPSITLASSSTSPSSLGRPPYPTLVSCGSSSTILTPAMTASRGLPPPFRISIAFAVAFIPFALDITTGTEAAAFSTVSVPSTPPARPAAEVILRNSRRLILNCIWTSPVDCWPLTERFRDRDLMIQPHPRQDIKIVKPQPATDLWVGS